MLQKNYSKTGTSCRVTFKLPAEVGATCVSLVGEFNDWGADTYMPNPYGSDDSVVEI